MLWSCCLLLVFCCWHFARSWSHYNWSAVTRRKWSALPTRAWHSPLIGQWHQCWPLIGWWWPVVRAPGLALSPTRNSSASFTQGRLQKTARFQFVFWTQMIEQHQWYPVIIWASIIRQRSGLQWVWLSDCFGNLEPIIRCSCHFYLYLLTRDWICLITDIYGAISQRWCLRSSRPIRSLDPRLLTNERLGMPRWLVVMWLQ